MAFFSRLPYIQQEYKGRPGGLGGFCDLLASLQPGEIRIKASNRLHETSMVIPIELKVQPLA